MLERQFLLGLFSVSLVRAQYPCPPQGGAYALCATTVLYIIDTSTDLTDVQIKAEFDWIRGNILPGTAWSTNQKAALISYGTGNVNSFAPTGNMSVACGQLNSLEVSYTSVGSSTVSLYTLLQTVNLYYGSTVTTMILFSGSKDSNDISRAADYIRLNMANQQFTVIAMNGANFNGFPATIYSVANLGDAPPNLGPCLLRKACNQAQTCDIDGDPDTTITYTTVDPKSSTSSATGPSSVQCQCNTDSVWVDVMFLLDGSGAGGQQGLQEIWTLVGTSLDFFTVQKTGYTGSNYTTRVGIITYGSTATVYKSLGSVNNDDIDNISPGDLPYFSGDMTNLEAAIQAAVAEFDGPNHRPNARKVIVVVATTYNPGGVTAPQDAAGQFITDNGVLVAFDYVQDQGVPSTVLQEIASPGYYLTSIAPQNDDYQSLNQALCDANCFCNNNYASYTDSSRKKPTGGCYETVEISANNRLAEQKCANFNGFLTSDESPEKSQWLLNLIHGNLFWLGLSYDTNSNQWKWADNSTLGSYHPWLGGTAPNGGCVFVTSNLQWQGTDCRNGYRYICETSPCDSLHYCTN